MPLQNILALLLDLKALTQSSQDVEHLDEIAPALLAIHTVSKAHLYQAVILHRRHACGELYAESMPLDGTRQ